MNYLLIQIVLTGLFVVSCNNHISGQDRPSVSIDSSQPSSGITLLPPGAFVKSTGISAQSVVNDSWVEAGNQMNIMAPAFNTQEVNLAQGNLLFSATDLVIPGFSGTSMSISRTYNSNRYESLGKLSPLGLIYDPWGAGSSGGWGFDFMMRAWVMQNATTPVFSSDMEADRSLLKVCIETNQGIEDYYYNSAANAYLSKNPANKNKVYIRDWADRPIHPPFMNIYSPIFLLNYSVVLITTSGKIFTFKDTFFYFCQMDKSGFNSNYIENKLPWIYLAGKNISSISTILLKTGGLVGLEETYPYEDPAHRIQFIYENSGAQQSNFNVWFLIQYYGKDFWNLMYYIGEKKIGNSATSVDKLYFNRLVKIKDPEGKELNFSYLASTPGRDTRQDGIISKITYKNTNGNATDIVYTYTPYAVNNATNYYLTSVQNGTLPPESYHYTFYNFAADQVFFNFYRQGYLLDSKTSLLGSSIQYSYAESRIQDQGDLVKYLTHLPVVTQKRIVPSEIGNTLDYTFTYPLGPTGWPKKESFSAGWNLGQTGYAFSSITVKNPFTIEKETHIFSQGVPITKIQGIFSSEITWNFNRMLPIKVTSKKNNIIQSTLKTDYDTYNNPSKITTQKSNSDVLVQEINYYTDDNVINRNLVGLPKLSTTTDPATGIKRYSYMTYTSLGQPYESYEGQDSSGKKLTTLTYDSVGRILSQTQYGPGGNVTVQYTYDLSGTTYTITQSLNGKTSTSVYETNTGSLKTSTDPNGNTTTYTYDEYGRPTQVTYPNGQTAQTTYSTDLKTTTISQGGRTVITTTDSLGRALQTTYPAGEDNVKYEYFYGNLPSKLLKQPGGSGAWVQKKSYTYDAYLRKLSSSSTDFGTITYAYDDANNKVTVTDPLGRSTTQTTDELGRQTTQVFNPDNSTTTSTYDGFNNPLTTTDPRLNTRKADYDAYGRITNTYHPYNSGTPKIRSTTVYKSNTPGFIDYVQVYDEQGNPFRKYGYVYDSENRLKNTLLNNVIKETLSYDESTQTNSKGALTTAENDDSKTQYSHDTMGRLQKTTTTIKAINKTYSIQQGYNPTNGNLASLTYPDNKQVTYTYDSHQRVQTMAYNGTTLCTYAYNPNGTLASLTYGNGIILTYTYTKDILLTTLTAKQGSNTLYTQSYTYDTLGKMTNTSHSDYFNYGPNLTRTYTYTPKDELKTVAINNTNTYTHNYDKAGNTLRFETLHNKNLGADNITVSTTKDQLTEKRQKDGRKTTFSYDPEGNMTQKNRIDIGGSVADTFQYTYNYQGQLQSINKNGYPFATYAYDHNNQRIYSAHSQDLYSKKCYYWANGQIIGEGVIDTQNASNNTDFSVRYFYSGNQKIAMERRDMSTGQTSLYYFINNAQGTPVLILDSSGQTKSRINLDEWGNLGMLQGPSQEINFTGKKLDVSTGLYYFNQRYYDPEIGRFLQEDPAGQGLNPYRYCGNNPLANIDPDGQFWFELLTLAGGLYGGCYEGTHQMLQGGDFGKGFIKGWIDGVKIGGSLGILIDAGTGGYATYNKENPFFMAMANTYVMAWQGQAGSAISVPFRDGSTNKNKESYTSPGYYTPPGVRMNQSSYLSELTRWNLNQYIISRNQWQSNTTMGAMIQEYESTYKISESEKLYMPPDRLQKFNSEKINQGIEDTIQNSPQKLIEGIDLITSPMMHSLPKMPPLYRIINKIKQWGKRLYDVYQS